jgi:hypothetical protein
VSAKQSAGGFHTASPVQLLEQLADGRHGQMDAAGDVRGRALTGRLRGQGGQDHGGVVGEFADAQHGVARVWKTGLF